MLSETSQTKTNTVWSHLHVESKIVEIIDTESKMVVARGWGVEVLVKGYKLSGIRRLSSGGLMYSMVTIVNNTVLYIESSHHTHTHTHKKVTMWGDRCVNYLYCGDHFTIYTYIKSSCFTP